MKRCSNIRFGFNLTDIPERRQIETSYKTQTKINVVFFPRLFAFELLAHDFPLDLFSTPRILINRSKGQTQAR